MLVHFAYSFVPDVFSNWPALFLNFIALTLAAYSVFFIAREIWAADMAALFVMAVFGTMYGVVNMAVLFRSYALLMMWAGLYSNFPGGGKIIPLVGAKVPTSIDRQELVEIMLEISRKKKATFIGFTRDWSETEAWLLE